MTTPVSRAHRIAKARRPTFCGHPVADNDWEVLLEIVATCGFSRHELARTICEALGWVRPNGALKTRECYEYLNVLESMSLVELPAHKHQRRRGLTRVGRTLEGEPGPQRTGRVSDVAPVMLGLVTSAKERALWRELVDRYHYLGHKVAYGAHLRYLVWTSKPRREVAGCLQFSSPARRLAVRDRFIGWDDGTRRTHLGSVVNNSRFLVLPWLQIDGFASHILSLAVRVLVDDWQEAYAVKPVLLETFVEQGRFEGTCYRAANWIEAGVTKGRGRMDRENRSAERVKLCFVYPLVRDFRARLGVEG